MISCCIITDGSPHLERCLRSVRPYVQEICVVSPRALLPVEPKYIDRFAVDDRDGHFHDGAVRDFSAIRRASFALATQPVILWLDSDDELIGGEHLAALAAQLTPPAWAWLPYDYEHDAAGNVTCSLLRERIVTRGDFEWQYRSHETLKPLHANTKRIDSDKVRIRHHRTKSEAAASTARTIRIFEDHPDSDRRAQFFLACARFDQREWKAARTAFRKYLAAAGGNDEEQRAITHMRLSTIAELGGELDEATAHAYAALCACEWAECYFAIARVHQAAAEAGGGPRQWQKVAHFARVGLSLPETRGSGWTNPMDRAFAAREMLAMALVELDDYAGAVAVADEALAVRDDEDLRGMVEAWRRKV